MADKEYLLKFKVEGQEGIDKAKQSIDGLDDKEVNVTVTTNDSQAEETKEKLDEIGNSDTTAEVKVEADTTQADETIEVLGEIDTTDVTANAEVSSDTTGAEEVKNAIEEVDGSEGTGNANTKSDLTGVDEAEQGLNNFDGSTATGEANVDNTGANSEIDETDSLLSELTSSTHLIEIGARIDTESIAWIQYVKDELKTLPTIVGGNMKDGLDLSETFSKASENFDVGYTDIVRALNNGNVKISGEVEKGLNDAFNIGFLDKPKMVLGNLSSLVSNTFKGIVGSITKGDIGGAISSITKGFGGIKDAFSSVYGASSNVAKLATSVGALAGKFAVVGTAIATATKFLTPFAQEGKKIAGLSDQLGMTAEAFQEMSIIGEKFGVSSDVMSSAVQRMFKNIENESPKAVASIEQLGISFDQFKKMSTEEQLKAVGEGLSKVTDASKRSAIAQNIFGASGKKMIKTCIEMAGASDNMAQSLAGQIAYTEEGTERSKGFMNALTEMKNRFKALITPITTAVMPAFTGLFDLISGGIALLKPILDPVFAFIGELCHMVGAFASGVGQAFQIVGDTFTTFEQKVSNSKVLSWFLGLGEAVEKGVNDSMQEMGESATKSLEGLGEATDGAKKSTEGLSDEVDDIDYSTVEDGTKTIEEQGDEWLKNSEYYKKYKGLIEENVADSTISAFTDSASKSADDFINRFKAGADTLEETKANIKETAESMYNDMVTTLNRQYEMGDIDDEQYKQGLIDAKVATDDFVKSQEDELSSLSDEEISIDVNTELKGDTDRVEELKARFDALPEEVQTEVRTRVENGETLTNVLKDVEEVRGRHKSKVTVDVDGTTEVADLEGKLEEVEDKDITVEEAGAKESQESVENFKKILDAVKSKSITIKTSADKDRLISYKNYLDSIKTYKQVTIATKYTGTNHKNISGQKEEAVATKRPQRFGTPTSVIVGEYQEEVILGTNIYEQALKNAMGSGVEQGAMMTANNLGSVASGVDSTLLHNDLMSILTTIRTMDAGSVGGNNVAINVVGGQITKTGVSNKSALINTTLRNISNKNNGITASDKKLVRALLEEIL